MIPDSPAASDIIAATRDWLETAVIGLDLCPFARSVHAAGRIRYAVSGALTAQSLLGELAAELQLLQAADPQVWETTLLIHPKVLVDFADYNDFLDQADDLIDEFGYDGVFQVASFHPRYRFAGTQDTDIENHTNRSPYPMLHLLREDSVARAVAAMPDTDSIYRRNIETLRRLGHEGWDALWQDPAKPAKR
jgi:uncharacterized protein